jgi:hypothetical protein
MARSKDSYSGARATKKIKRKGVHAKCKTSSNKNSKNYKKTYAGQGR